MFEILLNKMAIEPINVLEEMMENGKSFQEITLMKQNDFAIFFTHDFFKKLCDNKDKCILEHYYHK